MHRSVTKVLFVSTSNACRSLLAEACLRHLGQGKFKVFSCGVPSRIADAPDSWALLALQTAAIPTAGLSCKGWTEFMRNGAPRMDFVIALDAETLDTHPSWPGQPITALWDYPALATNPNKRGNVAVETVHMLMSMRRRIELLVSLHSRSKKRTDLVHDLQDMSHM
jgi:protein-tyrosine-phosphatase